MSLKILLLAAGGSGTFAIPNVPNEGTVTSLTSAPEGGWSWFEDPRAFTHGSYTYLGYNAGGDLKIAVVTAGAVVATRTVAAAFQYDDHDTPTFYVDPIADKLIIFYSRHLGAELFSRVSTNTLTADPDLSGGFAVAVDHMTGGSAWEVLADRRITYPSPLYTNDADSSGDDTLWVFYRCHLADDSAEWHYNASIDGGATYSGSGVRLHTLTYSKVESDGVGTIHVASSEHPNEGATQICHVYRQSGAWHKSDGSGAVGPQPYDATDMTIVWDGAGAGDLVWIADVAVEPGGNPVIVFSRYPSGTYTGTGLSLNTTDIRYMYARWTGSAWDVHEICAAGPQIVADGETPAGNGYPGGLNLDHEDPSIVWASRKIGSTWEMFRYVTHDGGATFTETQLTTASSSKQIRPVGVRNQTDISAVWLAGTYTDYEDYSLELRALLP